MKFHNSTAEIFIPDGQPISAALRRVTHLGIGAHADDLEFMAFHGILAGQEKIGFAGVTCTNGSGSTRNGKFAKFTDEQMMALRRQEQNHAAEIGRYAAMIQLDYPSRVVKDMKDTALEKDLRKIFAATRPQIIYTHNPADKHDTHVGVTLTVLRALRALPAAQRPSKVYGCEVWRDLDWLPDEHKVLLDVSGHDELAARLNSVFESQIAGGKRYDLAIAGRRRANATFFEPYAADQTTAATYALDLTPLLADISLDVAAYVAGFVEQFKADVQRRLNRER